ncbi:uncharacterized protein LOC143285641 [Babylonia areolata]|uniref:uncharacterized protein LOC143285641 n=1 Tax=Babylonia areolata TaxID=304850 RepID=UPI003FD4CBCD
MSSYYTCLYRSSFTPVYRGQTSSYRTCLYRSDFTPVYRGEMSRYHTCLYRSGFTPVYRGEMSMYHTCLYRSDFTPVYASQMSSYHTCLYKSDFKPVYTGQTLGCHTCLYRSGFTPVHDSSFRFTTHNHCGPACRNTLSSSPIALPSAETSTTELFWLAHCERHITSRVAMDSHRWQKVFCLAVLLSIAAFCYVYLFSTFNKVTLSSIPPLDRHQNTDQTLSDTIQDSSSTTPTNRNQQLLQRFASRCDHVKKECQARPQVYYGQKESTMNSEDNFLLDDVHHVLYCFIPKNGCSFWKRVFAIIDGSLQGKSVFNLSSTGIHRAAKSFDTLARGHRSLFTMYYHLQASKKVVFVRDPYERLFSGYVDKLFAPCTMTHTEKNIIQYSRNSWKKETICNRGVNFTEFLLYVTNERSISVNNHFGQQYTICHPCHIDYDFIGKLETFHEDATVVLQEAVHLDPSVVWGPEDQFEENSDINILEDMVQRTWGSCGGSCLPLYNVMLRLWIVFQVRGFLSVKHGFPLSREEAGQMTKEQFQALVLNTYKQSGDRGIVKQQRQQALEEAFRSVPLDLMDRVERYIDSDCRLFGYECSPTTRFHLDSPRPRPMFHMDEALVV